VILEEIIWKEQFAEKIEWKHRVSVVEVEEVLCSRPYALRAERGRVSGEDLFVAYGQTDAGRYLTIFFIHKGQATALPISARDMTRSERRMYERKKKR
jgi:hypothetical protein